MLRRAACARHDAGKRHTATLLEFRISMIFHLNLDLSNKPGRWELGFIIYDVICGVLVRTTLYVDALICYVCV